MSTRDLKPRESARTICLVRGVTKVLIPSVAIVMLAGTTSALAQNARDVMNLFNTLMRGAIIESVRAEWNKIPRDEFSCLEQRLQQQSDSLLNLAERGILPETHD
jgi:hypothetical protein